MASYHEKVEATVELNLSDFEAKLRAADAEINRMAAKKNVRESGEGFVNAGQAMIAAAKDAMEKFALNVMVDAVSEVPVDTGVLHDSWGISDPYKTGNRVKVTMGFGYGDEINPKTKRTADQYAMPVHEIYDVNHEPPTKDHYLIDPLLTHARHYSTDLAVAMKHEGLGTFVRHRFQKGRPVYDFGQAHEETRAPALGGGFAFRGGNPQNAGQFSRRPK